MSVNGPRLSTAIDLPTSKEKYLESEYFKLHYEAIQPLQDALHDYKQNNTTPLDTVNVYPDVGSITLHIPMPANCSFTGNKVSANTTFRCDSRVLC